MSKSVSVQVKCPLCNSSLMDNEHRLHDKSSIKLNIHNKKERGVIHLCSIYGCYDHACNISLSGNETAEFTCPHCNQILNSSEKCRLCDAHMVPLNLDIGGRVVMCSREGCKNHYVAFENPNDAITRFYEEYGF